ncbi:MAG TPA: transcriptional regulator, partial [Rhizobiales bacterium]|nr:transcriptional regulator [Hyphomicrobiales bacterium]
RHSGTRSAWPRTEARLLGRTSMVPVLAPALLENGTVLRTPEDIRQFDLLHEENRSYWSDWFRMAGAPEENHDRGPVFADGSLVLQAALRGHGAALSDPAFIEEDLRDGRLVAPFDIRMPCGAYYLVARSFKALPKPAAALAAWILSRFPSG